MDRRRWLWKKRKPWRKSPGGSTDASGSTPSSLPKKQSNNQEGLQRSPPGQPPPPEAPPSTSSDDQQTIKDLTSRLSAALASVRAKEDLANQHTKLAEEAVSGWEKAESQLATLKKQLEATTKRNSSLEDRIQQLNVAFKDCVRELGQTRSEQEKKVHDMLAERNGEWKKEKSALETHLVELQHQLEAADRESKSMNHDLQVKLDAVEKEKADLKLRLLDQTKQLRLRTRDMELSTLAAEAASKQHLESKKKVAKVEAECRRLQAVIRKAPPHDEQRIPTTISASPPKQMVGLDNGTSIAEVQSSPLSPNLHNGCDDENAHQLMDDFLEMERLAASHDPGLPNGSATEDGQLKFNNELDLQRKDEKMIDGQLRRSEVVQRAAYSIQKLKIEQERDMAAVAGNFKKCQQKIASLSRQLNSLATLDDFVLEDEKQQSEGLALEADDEINFDAFLKSSEDTVA